MFNSIPYFFILFYPKKTHCMRKINAVTACAGIALMFALVHANATFTPTGIHHNFAATTKKDSVQYEKFKDLPLKPERKISFTTSEGTWTSLDVSPDGKTIAFDLMGDIYTVPVTGGEATAVTKGISFDTHPRYSPDGKRLLFTSDRSGAENLWYIDFDKKDTVH